MEARRAAELDGLEDNLRAVLGCVVVDGEWAAADRPLREPPSSRMIKAGGMARKV